MVCFGFAVPGIGVRQPGQEIGVPAGSPARLRFAFVATPSSHGRTVSLSGLSLFRWRHASKKVIETSSSASCQEPHRDRQYRKTASACLSNSTPKASALPAMHLRTAHRLFPPLASTFCPL